MKLFFKFEKWTKIIVHILILQKSFKSFFYKFFWFLFWSIIYVIVSNLCNADILEKVVQSIRKNVIFRTFFTFFCFFFILKKWKKRVNGPKKTSISTFFNVFRNLKACVVWRFSKIKRSFFSVHFWTVFNPRGDALASF